MTNKRKTEDSNGWGIPGPFRNDLVNGVIWLLILWVGLAGIFGNTVPMTGQFLCDHELTLGDCTAKAVAGNMGGSGDNDEDNSLKSGDIEVNVQTSNTATLYVRSKNYLTSTSPTGSKDFTPTQNFMIYDEDGNYVGNITTTAAETEASVTLDINHDYKLVPLASSTSGSYIMAADQGEIVDGNLIIKDFDKTTYIVVEVKKMETTLKFLAYDNSGTLMYNDSASTSYTPVANPIFKTSSSNSTATAIGAGEFVKRTIEFNADSYFEDFADGNVFVFIDVGTEKSKYQNAPSLTLGSITLYESTSLKDHESDAATNDGYDWIYDFPGTIAKAQQTLVITYDTVATTGDTSGDFKVCFATRGNYESNKETRAVYNHIYQDNANTYTAVHAFQCVTFDNQ